MERSKGADVQGGTMTAAECAQRKKVGKIPGKEGTWKFETISLSWNVRAIRIDVDSGSAGDLCVEIPKDTEIEVQDDDQRLPSQA